MSYRVWINAFDMSFMSTRTESNRDLAEGLAKELAKNIPGAVVGVDAIQSEFVFRNNGAPEAQPEPSPTALREAQRNGMIAALDQIAMWLRNGAGEERAKGTVAFEESVMPLYRELAEQVDSIRATMLDKK